MKKSVKFRPPAKAFPTPPEAGVQELGSRLAARLRARRNALKIGLHTLAAASGVSVNTIVGMEKEEYSPRLDNVQRVAAALGMDAWQLLKP